jgi:hypothetical protein
VLIDGGLQVYMNNKIGPSLQRDNRAKNGIALFQSSSWFV